MHDDEAERRDGSGVQPRVSLNIVEYASNNGGVGGEGSTRAPCALGKIISRRS